MMRHATDSGRLVLAPVRRQHIVELLQQREFLTNEEIRSATNASIATVRRDLALLEQMGRLIRVRGGIMRIRPSAQAGTGDAARKIALALATLREGDIDTAEVLLRSAIDSCQQIRSGRR